ncbi:hypothetical protein GGI12_004896 [Dipsacomyces acuminosporus]|nr:hypothetical protein GGI12_004896 [Dipsacomyces acuminosporus]
MSSGNTNSAPTARHEQPPPGHTANNAQGSSNTASPSPLDSNNASSTGARDTRPLIAPNSQAERASGSSLDLPGVALQHEKPHPYPFRFGPWWRFSSAADRAQPKARILPCAAAIFMPVTVLFVLTAVEANWIQSAPGYSGHRIRKAGGYAAGNGIAVALAFGSALTIPFRQLDHFRKYASLTTAMLAQVLVNALIGFVCILVGGLYQRNRVNYKDVWITPEYPCIFIGGFFAFLQMALLLIDYVTTPNFNQRGSGYGSPAMETAIGLANLVNIWTGFGSLVFSNVEANSVWHPYNSCFNSWVLLITTGSSVLPFRTTNSKVFILFWLPVGLLLMVIYFLCFGVGFVQRFDEKPLRRIAEAEDNLRAAYRELRRDGAQNKELAAAVRGRITSLHGSIEYMRSQRLRYFAILFSFGVLLKILSWLLGSIIFARTEIGWSYWDSMMFLFFNLLTVGVQGMVPHSASGMPLYHAYTYIDILCTAALDAMLFHILYNLVPWPKFLHATGSFFGRAASKLFRRRRHLETSSIQTDQGAIDSQPSYSYSVQQAGDKLDDVLNAAARLRGILVQNSASQADISEYERLLEIAESRLDDANMLQKKVD